MIASLTILVSAGTLAVVGPAHGASPTPAARLTTALSTTSTYYTGAGYELTAKTPSLKTISLTRRGTTTLYRAGGVPTLILTPSSVFHAATEVVPAALGTQAASENLQWVRYSQYSPQALPDLLDQLRLNPVVKVSVSSVTRGTRNVYTVTGRSGEKRKWTVTTNRDRNGRELIEKVVLVDPSGSAVRDLARGAGLRELPAENTPRSTTFTLTGTRAVLSAPAVGTWLDPLMHPDLLDTSGYDLARLEVLARDVLFSANRLAEGNNRSITAVEINRALVGYRPQENAGLLLRAVGARLEIAVTGPSDTTRRCAVLTRYDYTTESLLVVDGAC